MTSQYLPKGTATICPVCNEPTKVIHRLDRSDGYDFDCLSFSGCDRCIRCLEFIIKNTILASMKYNGIEKMNVIEKEMSQQSKTEAERITKDN